MGVREASRSITSRFLIRTLTSEEILEALESGQNASNLFDDDWVFRPNDLLCQPAYKQALLELEAAGKLEVLEKDGRTPKPAEAQDTRESRL